MFYLVQKFDLKAGGTINVPRVATNINIQAIAGASSVSIRLESNGSQAEIPEGVGLKLIKQTTSVEIHNHNAVAITVKVAFSDSEIQDNRLNLVEGSISTNGASEALKVGVVDVEAGESIAYRDNRKSIELINRGTVSVWIENTATTIKSSDAYELKAGESVEWATKAEIFFFKNTGVPAVVNYTELYG